MKNLGSVVFQYLYFILKNAFNYPARHVRRAIINLLLVPAMGMPIVTLAQTPVTWTDLVGVSVSGNTLTKEAPNGWGNAGAASMESIPADGEVSMRIDQLNTGLMFGLSVTNLDADYRSIDYAIQLRSDGRINLFEKGKGKSLLRPYNIGDRVSVERLGSQIHYKHNGIVFYSSDVVSFGPLIVDTSINHNNGRIADVLITFPVEPIQNRSNDPLLHFGVAKNVSDAWVTINLPNTYQDMVVVTTPVIEPVVINGVEYFDRQVPALTRIRNAQGNSFQMKLQYAAEPDVIAGQPTLPEFDVHYLVVEVGSYTVAEHGITMEAAKMTSTSSEWGLGFRNYSNWIGQSHQYVNAYTSPVVVGQVMTYNDPQWSAFWCRGPIIGNPVPQSAQLPTSNELAMGKHIGRYAIGELPVRADETLGYIIVEGGSTFFKNMHLFAQQRDRSEVNFNNFYQLGLALPFQPHAIIGTRAGIGFPPSGWANLVARPNHFLLVHDQDIFRNNTTRTHAEGSAIIAFAKLASVDITLLESGSDRDSVEVDYTITDTSGVNVTDVVVYWDSVDRGEIEADWQSSIELTGLNRGDGAFTEVINGLDPAVTYFFKVKVSSPAGTFWSSTQAFTTPAAIVLPTVTIASIDAVTQDAANINFAVSATGGEDVTDVTIYWDTSDQGTGAWNNSSIVVAGPSGVIAGTLPVSGLLPNTTYYFKCSATNSAGIAWSNTQAVTTLAEEPPVVIDTPTKLHHGVLNDVMADQWQTVTLPQSYNAMVVVATVATDFGRDLPVVSRVRNAAGNRFEVKVQPAAYNYAVDAGDVYDVHYIVVEEGVYTAADNDGVVMEAHRFDATLRNLNISRGWSKLHPLTYVNSYTNPVVLGQVISENDARWSVFWARGSERKEAPTSTLLQAGKHIASDNIEKTRASETVGYIVLESGSGTIGGRAFVSGIANSGVTGFDDSTQATVSVAIAPATVVLSSAGMVSKEGGWPCLWGSVDPTSNSFSAIIDEDIIADAERSHVSESVAYFAIESEVTQPPQQDSSVTISSLGAPDGNTVVVDIATAPAAGDEITEVTLYWGSSGEGNQDNSKLIIPGPLTQLSFNSSIITGLLPETTYFFSVSMKSAGTGGLIWSASASITTPAETPSAETAAKLSHDVIRDIGINVWQTVTLPLDYQDMVVVATAATQSGNLPVVTRVDRPTGGQGNTFSVMVQPAAIDGSGYQGQLFDIHYVVVEAGVYTAQDDGFTMEANTHESTGTAYKSDRNRSWKQGDQRFFVNTYTSPVVLGQVMSYAQPEWSVFWGFRDKRRTKFLQPPTGLFFYSSKHTGEDAGVRVNETIGYIVLESGLGNIGSTKYTAGVTSSSIMGMSAPTPIVDLGITPSSVVLSMAGINTTDGGWPCLIGQVPTLNDAMSIDVIVDEDIVADSERDHTGGSVAYLAFESSIMLPTVSVAATDDITSDTALIQWTIADTGGANIDELSVHWTKNTTPPGPWTDTGPINNSSLGVGQGLYALTGLEPDTEYLIYLTATNAAGAKVSNVITIKTQVAGVSAPSSYTRFIQLSPVADAFVNGGSRRKAKNYGADTSLDFNNNKSTFIRFELSELNPPVTDAVLKLNVTELSDSYGKIDLHFVDNDSWVESTINWRNAPTQIGPVVESIEITELGIAAIPITDLVNQEASGDGVLTVMLRTPNVADTLELGSRESAIAPWIEFEEPSVGLDGYEWIIPQTGGTFKVDPVAPSKDHYVSSGCVAEFNETIWFDDAYPATAATVLSDNWYFGTSTNQPADWSTGTVPMPYSGNKAAFIEDFSTSITTYSFSNVAPADEMRLWGTETIFVYAYLNPIETPEAIMLQFYTRDGGEYRAYWGANRFSGGVENTPSRLRVGELPLIGNWVRLEVPAASLDLVGKQIHGMAYSVSNGFAAFDKVGYTNDTTNLEVYNDQLLRVTNNLARSNVDGINKSRWLVGNCQDYSTENYESRIAKLLFDVGYLKEFGSVMIISAKLRLTPLEVTYTSAPDNQVDANVLLYHGHYDPADWLDPLQTSAKIDTFAVWLNNLGIPKKSTYLAPTPLNPHTPEIVFDVTDLVEDALSPSNLDTMLPLSVFIEPQDSNALSAHLAFHSSRGVAGYGPQLEIQYDLGFIDSNIKNAVTGDDKYPDPIPEGNKREHPNIDLDVQDLPNYEPFGGVTGISGVDSEGNFTYMIPIDVSPGINGMTPSIALVYNSGTLEETNLGQGWKLEAGQSRISRRRLNYIYDGEYSLDLFDLSKRGFQLDEQPLFYIPENKFFATREDMHGRVTRRKMGLNSENISHLTDNATDDVWKIEYKSGLTEYLDHRVRGNQAVGSNIFAKAWLTSAKEDRWKNKITYKYLATNQNFVQYIDYAFSSPSVSHARVEFKYEANDVENIKTVYSDGIATFLNNVRKKEIRVFTGNILTRKYVLNYSNHGIVGKSYLDSVEVYAANDHGAGADNALVLLDEHKFNYDLDEADGFGGDGGYEIPLPISGTHEIQKVLDNITFTPRANWADAGVRVHDYNNDGLPDLLQNVKYNLPDQGNPESPSNDLEELHIKKIYRNTGSGFEDVSQIASEAKCIPPVDFLHLYLDDTLGTSSIRTIYSTFNAIMVDVNGDGNEDIVTNNGTVFINQVYGSADFLNADSLWKEDSGYSIPIPEGFDEDLLFKHNTIFDEPGIKQKVLIQDFNGDGLADIFFTKDDRNSSNVFKIALLLNQGKLNGDSSWDLSYSYDIQARVIVFDGSGVDAEPINYAYQRWYVDLGDEDGNGTPDKDEYLIPPGLLHLENQVNSTFTKGTLVDLNGDGLQDFVYGDFTRWGFSTNPSMRNAVNALKNSIFYNDGKRFVRAYKPDGSLLDLPVPLYATYVTLNERYFIQATEFVDLNNDGIKDVVHHDKHNPNNRSAFINTGADLIPHVGFIPPALVNSNDGLDMGTRFIDLNADGYNDYISSFEVTGQWNGETDIPSNFGLNLGQMFAASSQDPKYKVEPLSNNEKLGWFERFLRGLPELTQDIAYTLVDPDPMQDAQTISDIYNIVAPSPRGLGTGQELFDINGDGAVDSVYTQSSVMYDWRNFTQGNNVLKIYPAVTGIKVDKSTVKLNKRSKTYGKLQTIKSNLTETTVDFDYLANRNVYLTKAKYNTPGGLYSLEKQTNYILPHKLVVTNSSHTLGGVKHQLDYYYGKYARKYGKGYFFGDMWTVDNIGKTVSYTRRNDSGNYAQFGRVSDNISCNFALGQSRFDRNNSTDRQELINLAETDNSSAIAIETRTTLEYAVWQPYLSGTSQFNIDNTVIVPLKANPPRNVFDRYRPFFVTSESNQYHYDLQSPVFFAEEYAYSEPTRYGGAKKSYHRSLGNIIRGNPADKNDATSNENDIDVSWNVRSEDTVDNNFTYYINDDIWLVDHPRSSTTTSKSGQWDERSLTTEYLYEDYVIGSLGSLWKLDHTSTYGTSDLGPLPAAPSSTIVENTDKINNYAQYVQHFFKYDAYGNVIEQSSRSQLEAIDNEYRSHKITYVQTGPLQGRAIEIVTHSANPNTSQTSWSTMFPNHDIHTLKPGITIDKNGLVTQVEYDVYERPRKLIAPDGRITITNVIEDTNSNDNVAYIVRTATSGPMYHYAAMDNIARPLKQWSPGPEWSGNDGSNGVFDATWTQIISEYNDSGTIRRVSKPLPWSNAMEIPDGGTEVDNDYDHFDRIRSVRHRGQLVSTYHYSFGKTSSNNRAPYPGVQIPETVAVVDAVGDETITTNYGNAARVTTSEKGGKVYEFFTVDGQTKAIRTDANANNAFEINTGIYMDYDPFGHRIQLDDPSFGIIKYASNGFGEMVRVEKNFGTPDVTIIDYQRDDFGRPTQVTYNGKRRENPNDTAGQVKDTRIESYVFDTNFTDGAIENNFKGFLYTSRLSVAGKPQYVQVDTPDALGRLRFSTTRIFDYTERGNNSTPDLHLFNAETQYDALSRVLYKVYPHKPGDTPYRVDYFYSSDFRMEEIRDKGQTHVLWAARDVDRDGFLRAEQLGNKTMVAHNPDGRNRLIRTSAINTDPQVPSQRDLMSADYSYYDDNNMLTRSFDLHESLSDSPPQTPATTLETFGYDGLKQLTSVSHLYSPKSGGSDIETQLSYDYDLNSRMFEKSRIVSNPLLMYNVESSDVPVPSTGDLTIAKLNNPEGLPTKILIHYGGSRPIVATDANAKVLELLISGYAGIPWNGAALSKDQRLEIITKAKEIGMFTGDVNEATIQTLFFAYPDIEDHEGKVE